VTIQHSICVVADPCYFFFHYVRSCSKLFNTESGRLDQILASQEGKRMDLMFWIVGKVGDLYFCSVKITCSYILPCFVFYALLIYQVLKTFIYVDWNNDLVAYIGYTYIVIPPFLNMEW
jgi:hypothetical protein